MISRYIVVIILCVPMVSFGSEQVMERYAFIAASNDGGPSREKLRYAETDALSFANVFEDIGGLKSKNKVVSLSPNKEEFLGSLSRFKTKLEKRNREHAQTQMVFYFSGHSNDQGLLLKDGIITYKDLRAELESVQADVRMAILDSCQSGAFTRTKGGQRQSSFLVDSSQKVTGNVFLTASTENEAAQESDNVGGSFFTHYLVSALRGAGDISGDRRVTLNEAYYYAFNETLARTEATKDGPQHPAYDIQIAGAGDLVLTDIKQTAATLVVPRNIVGRLYIRDSSGRLIVELNKIANNDVSLAVGSGSHQIILDEQGRLHQISININDGDRVVLDRDQFFDVVIEKNRSRGDGGLSLSDISDMFSIVLPDSNVVQVGAFYRHQEHQPFLIYSFPGAVPNYYIGYTLGYQKNIHRNIAIRSAFSEAKGFGVVRNFSFDILTSIWGDDLEKKKGKRLYVGAGLFLHRLYDFPEPYRLKNASISEWAERYAYGVQMPVGVQWEVGRYMVDIGTLLRVDQHSARNVVWGDAPDPIFTIQSGIRF